MPSNKPPPRHELPDYLGGQIWGNEYPGMLKARD